MNFLFRNLGFAATLMIVAAAAAADGSNPALDHHPSLDVAVVESHAAPVPPNSRVRDVCVMLRIAGASGAGLRFNLVRAVFYGDGKALSTAFYRPVRLRPGIPPGVGGAYFPGEKGLEAFKAPLKSEAFTAGPGVPLTLEIQSANTQLGSEGAIKREVTVELYTDKLVLLRSVRFKI